MSHSFLGRSPPLRDDELIKWASDGFPSDKLWNAPMDTILDAASEFIVFRDLTLQRLKILNLTVKCLPGTSDEGPYAEAFPVSHTARLDLATLIMRFSTLSTNMSAQELQAYYLLESMRKDPFSDNRDAIRLTGYCLVDIIEYFFRLDNADEHPLYPYKTMKLASGVISRSLDELRKNEKDMYETYLRAWEYLRRAEDWINKNYCPPPPPTMVPLTTEVRTKPVLDAFGYHFENIRGYGGTGGLSVQPTNAPALPDRPADVAAEASVDAAPTQAVPISNDAPSTVAYDLDASSADCESVANPLVVVRLPPQLSLADPIPEKSHIEPDIPQAPPASNTKPEDTSSPISSLNIAPKDREVTAVPATEEQNAAVPTPEQNPVTVSEADRETPKPFPIKIPGNYITFQSEKSPVPTTMDRHVATPTITQPQPEIPTVIVTDAVTDLEKRLSLVSLNEVDKAGQDKVDAESVDTNKVGAEKVDAGKVSAEELNVESVDAEKSVKSKKARRKGGKANKTQAKQVEAENAEPEEVAAEQSDAEKGTCITTDPVEESCGPKPETASCADAMQADAVPTTRTKAQRKKDRRKSKKDALVASDPFGHYGAMPVYGSWAEAMRSEIESVTIGARGGEMDLEREKAKARSMSLRLGRK